ncbi:uncharacterized protein LOC128147532 isoform X2 [Harpia harpyja]|uniref:uncharacterized protein LOC128147532 isoform X2 n=1 Tax=Harpia harpyja TaxID=202280 RepID=UPI0022B1F6B0|nr:uncharacterized protein LOC128147532 isoform X2 [Harpia harpyja]
MLPPPRPRVPHREQALCLLQDTPDPALAGSRKRDPPLQRLRHQVQEIPGAVPTVLERPREERDPPSPVSPLRGAVSPGRRREEVTARTPAAARGRR